MSEVTEDESAPMAVSSSDPGPAMVAHGGGRIAVGLVQINNSFSGQNYLPYSVGILQAYAQRHAKNPERFHFLAPLY